VKEEYECPHCSEDIIVGEMITCEKL
jgi:hypothetical protein